MFENLQEYEKYISGLSLDGLRDIERTIDRDRFPDRYELVQKYIQKRSGFSELADKPEKKFTDEKRDQKPVFKDTMEKKPEDNGLIMQDHFIEKIKENMKKKETEELLEIYKKQDRQYWSAEAFEAIRIVLKERNIHLHQQMQNDKENSVTESDQITKPKTDPLGFLEDSSFASGCGMRIIMIIIGIIIFSLFDSDVVDKFFDYFQYVYYAFIVLGIGIVLYKFSPINRLIFLKRKRRYHDAIEYCLDKISRGSAKLSIYKTLAKCYTMLGNINHAIRYYQSALSMGYQDVEVYLNLAVLVGEQKKFHLAWNYIKKGQELRKKKWLLGRLPKFMISEPMAWVYYLNGDSEKAFEHYDRAEKGYVRRRSFLMRYTEDMSPIYFRFGKIELSRGNHSEAEKYFRWSIKSSSKSIFAQKSEKELSSINEKFKNNKANIKKYEKHYLNK